MLKPKALIDIDHKKKFVTLCAWCEKPDVKAKREPSDFPLTKKYEAQGFACSHGMCEYHSKNF